MGCPAAAFFETRTTPKVQRREDYTRRTLKGKLSYFFAARKPSELNHA